MKVLLDLTYSFTREFDVPDDLKLTEQEILAHAAIGELSPDRLVAELQIMEDRDGAGTCPKWDAERVSVAVFREAKEGEEIDPNEAYEVGSGPPMITWFDLD